MIISLPSWYSEVKEELTKTVYRIANKHNLKFTFVVDSRAIEEGVGSILNGLVNIYENAPGELDENTIKEFKEMKKIIRGKDEKKKSSS